MLLITKQILALAVSAQLKDTSRDLCYHVHCAYGDEMGHGSEDMLSMSVKSELTALGFIF